MTRHYDTNTHHIMYIYICTYILYIIYIYVFIYVYISLYLYIRIYIYTRLYGLYYIFCIGPLLCKSDDDPSFPGENWLLVA